jgi:hypothetical protein
MPSCFPPFQLTPEPSLKQHRYNLSRIPSPTRHHLNDKGKLLMLFKMIMYPADTHPTVLSGSAERFPKVVELTQASMVIQHDFIPFHRFASSSWTQIAQLCNLP